jgi:phage-related protein
MACALWTLAGVAHPSSGTYSLGIGVADFADLYSGQTGNAPKYPSAFGATRAGMVWRALESNADQTVTLGFRVKALSGAAHDWDDAMTMCLVGARIQGGTYTSATNSYTDVTGGYCFGFLRTQPLGASWYIFRIDGAGSVTPLYSRVFTGTDIVLSGELNTYESNELELTVEDVAGDVQLTGKLRTPSGGLVTIGTYTDTSGSKITTAGRSGFWIDGKRSVTGGVVVSQATFFQIVDGGSLYLRDEWQRAWRSGALAETDTVAGIVWDGFSLMQGWIGDWYGPTTYRRLMYRSTVGGLTDRVNFDPSTDPVGSGTGAGGFLASNRRSTDKRSQNRSVQARFSTLQQDGTAGTTDPNPSRAVGVFVRFGASAAPSSTLEPTQAYLFALFRDDALAATYAKLYRWSNGALTTLAEKVPFTVSADTNYTIRLDAYNQRDAGGNNTGAVVLRGFVDGVQVVLESPATGISVDASGTVTDGTAQRIVEGSVEGVYVFLPSGDKTIFLDTWAEGSLTNPSSGNPQDMASIAVPNEVASDTSETLTIPVDWPIQELHYQPVNEARFESGHVRVSPRFTDERRVWEVAAAALTDDDRDDLRAFWETHSGVEKTFSWVPPGQTASVKVGIVEPESALEETLRDVGVTSFRFQLEQRIDG